MLSAEQRFQGLNAFLAADYEKAFDLLHAASDDDDADIHEALGWLYESGNAGLADYELAKKHYSCSAAKGSADALNRLGKMLKRRGAIDEAERAFREGAEIGDLPSMCDLGLLLVENAEPESSKEGISWIQKSAENGHLYAQRWLLLQKRKVTKSLVTKFKITVQIFRINMRGTRTILKDPNSQYMV